MPSADRLARSKEFLADVSRQVAAGVRYSDETITEIIRVLLRVILNVTHTTPELSGWFLTPEVNGLGTHLGAGDRLCGP